MSDGETKMVGVGWGPDATNGIEVDDEEDFIEQLAGTLGTTRRLASEVLSEWLSRRQNERRSNDE